MNLVCIQGQEKFTIILMGGVVFRGVLIVCFPVSQPPSEQPMLYLNFPPQSSGVRIFTFQDIKN
jgi:hypothetical protein